MQEDLFRGDEAKALTATCVEIGLHGQAPKSYAKHVKLAKRLLQDASLQYWQEVVCAMREYVFPYTEGEPFDLFDVERKEHIAMAAKRIHNELPRWLRLGWANNHKPEEPRLGSEWEK